MADDLYSDLRLYEKSLIRLLNIDRTSSSASEIHCSLEVADLEADPVYQALSYTWDSAYHLPQGEGNAEGESKPPRLTFVVCNGRKVEVTRNLFDALAEFRKREDVQNLWVDALCINQTDNAERSKPVLLMGDIYAQAREVLIWLETPTRTLSTSNGQQWSSFHNSRSFLRNTRLSMFSAWKL